MKKLYPFVGIVQGDGTGAVQDGASVRVVEAGTAAKQASTLATIQYAIAVMNQTGSWIAGIFESYSEQPPEAGSDLYPSGDVYAG